MRAIRVELTREEALAVLDGLKNWSSERLIMSAGAKLLVAVNEEERGHGQGEPDPTSIVAHSPVCCRPLCNAPAVEEGSRGGYWYCTRHWEEAIHEGDPSRGY